MNTTLINLLSCCRICLNDITPEDNAVHIDESLRIRFFQITGMELIDDPDIYSNIICEYCCNRINEFSHYRTELIVSQSSLYDCNKMEVLQIEEPANQPSNIEEYEQFECIVQESDNDEEIYLVDTKKDTPKNQKKDCHICGLSIASNGYYQHLNRVHKIGNTFECDYCGKRCSLKYDLFSHMRKHLSKESRKKYPCHFCDSVLLSNSSLNNHLKSLHSDVIEIHPCDFFNCEKSFQSRMKLLQHKKTVHEGGKYTCGICLKFYSTKQYLQKHIKQCHIAKELQKCDVCAKSIPQGSQFRQHMLTHSGQAFICTYDNCNRKFNFKGSLVKHIQTHHETTQAVNCNFCNFSFPTLKHLNRHISRQHNEVKVECEVQGCNQLFARKDYLSSHYKNHKDIDDATKQKLLERVKTIKIISW